MTKNKPFINQMEPSYDDKEKNAIIEYLNGGGWITEFKKTRELEEMIAGFVGTKFCSILPNGTLTLWAALHVLGVGPGDEVIVPDYTMVATMNAVTITGAKPVLVDIKRETLCINEELVAQAIGPKTKAVIVVSINGRSPDMEVLQKLTKKKGIHLIEDAAQSLGSRYRGKHLGGFGIFGSFSFSMPKIITMGQGGALVTDDEESYKRLKKLKDFGRISGGRDEYDSLGINLKFIDLLAVFGIEQMKKLSRRIKRKKEIYKLYSSRLSGLKDLELVHTNLIDVTPWFIDILVNDPKNLQSFLLEKGIGSRQFYPALHSLPFAPKTKILPKISSEISKRGLWLPSSVTLSNTDIRYICDSITNYFSKKKRS